MEINNIDLIVREQDGDLSGELAELTFAPADAKGQVRITKLNCSQSAGGNLFASGPDHVPVRAYCRPSPARELMFSKLWMGPIRISPAPVT
jgi:hypothetical protein